MALNIGIQVKTLICLPHLKWIAIMHQLRWNMYKTSRLQLYHNQQENLTNGFTFQPEYILFQSSKTISPVDNLAQEKFNQKKKNNRAFKQDCVPQNTKTDNCMTLQ